jgi:hypothetical protein
MSRQTLALLDEYEALPEDEKRAFTAEFLRRAIPFDSGPLDDDETANAADQLFAVFDDEATQVRKPGGDHDSQAG